MYDSYQADITDKISTPATTASRHQLGLGIRLSSDHITIIEKENAIQIYMNFTLHHAMFLTIYLTFIGLTREGIHILKIVVITAGLVALILLGVTAALIFEHRKHRKEAVKLPQTGKVMDTTAKSQHGSNTKESKNKTRHKESDKTHTAKVYTSTSRIFKPSGHNSSQLLSNDSREERSEYYTNYYLKPVTISSKCFSPSNYSQRSNYSL